MSAIQKSTDIGNGVGYLYVKDKSEDNIVKAFRNTLDGAIKFRSYVGVDIAIRSNAPAHGSIEINSVVAAGGETVTSLTIGGIEQLNNPVPFTGATTPSALAALIVAEINGFSPATRDYTATQDGAFVRVKAPASLGSTANGDAIVMSVSGGTVTHTIEIPAGGYDVDNDSQYYTFWIHADASATATTVAGGATDITSVIVPRTISSGAIVETIKLVSGKISLTRRSSMTYVRVDSEAGLTDDATDLVVDGVVDGDMFILSRGTTGETITVKPSGNFTLAGSPTDYVMSAEGDAIWLQYSESLNAYIEKDRGAQLGFTDAQFRTDGISHVGESGSKKYTILAAGGTDTVTPGTDPNFSIVKGTGVVLLANYEIEFSAAVQPMDGEEFWFDYTGVSDVNGFTVKVAGTTLPEELAESSAIIIAKYNLADTQFEVRVIEPNDGTSVASVSKFRAAGYAFTGTEGVETIAVTTGGTINVVVNSNKRVISFSGTSSLIADLDLVLDTTGAIKGDKIYVDYTGNVTTNGFDVTIGGATPFTLTDSMALNGGLFLWCYFDGVAWQCAGFYNLGSGGFKLDIDVFPNDLLTPAQVTAEMRSELVYHQASFDTGALGAVEIEMPYKGKIIEVNYSVNKLIEATDDASVTCATPSGVFATESFAGGTAVGSPSTTDAPTLNNTFNKGDKLTITTSKVTPGGGASISFEIERVA